MSDNGCGALVHSACSGTPVLHWAGVTTKQQLETCFVLCVCVFVCMLVCVFVYMCVAMCLHACVSVCVAQCLSIQLYVCARAEMNAQNSCFEASLGTITKRSSVSIVLVILIDCKLWFVVCKFLKFHYNCIIYNCYESNNANKNPRVLQIPLVQQVQRASYHGSKTVEGFKYNKFTEASNYVDFLAFVCVFVCVCVRVCVCVCAFVYVCVFCT